MTSCFPCIGGSITDLSVADNCLFGRRWRQSCPNIPMRRWSILTTIENFIWQERPQCGGTLRPCMQVYHRWTPIRAVMKCYSRIHCAFIRAAGQNYRSSATIRCFLVLHSSRYRDDEMSRRQCPACRGWQHEGRRYGTSDTGISTNSFGG